MGYWLSSEAANKLLQSWRADYRVFAPKRFAGGATFSDTDCIRYGEITDVSEIVSDRKSDYSFKEVLLPLCETLFFFTEQQVKEADPPAKDAIIFLRSCDLYVVRLLCARLQGSGVGMPCCSRWADGRCR